MAFQHVDAMQAIIDGRRTYLPPALITADSEHWQIIIGNPAAEDTNACGIAQLALRCAQLALPQGTLPSPSTAPERGARYGALSRCLGNWALRALQNPIFANNRDVIWQDSDNQQMPLLLLSMDDARRLLQTGGNIYGRHHDPALGVYVHVSNVADQLTIEGERNLINRVGCDNSLRLIALPSSSLY